MVSCGKTLCVSHKNDPVTTPGINLLVEAEKAAYKHSTTWLDIEKICPTAQASCVCREK